MDPSQEEMKSVGFFGIFKESFKTIFSWNKIFAQITLTLILPLSIIFLAHMSISSRFFSKIERNSIFQTHRNHQETATDWLYYWLFKLAYFTFLTVFSLLSTAAIVYTIASVYTGRDVIYHKVMKVVPKVWKRLFVTFICTFLAFFIYDLIAGFAVFLSRFLFGYSVINLILSIIILIMYVFGFLYLSVVWQLASVVTVLERPYGFKAMMRGKHLVKGKRVAAIGTSFVLYAFLVGIMLVYGLFVEYGGEVFEIGIGWRVLIGLGCLILLLCLFLVLIVSQTVLYLVCKSYHREVINKVNLSTYLGSYLEETLLVPSVVEEIQLGRPQPQRPSEV